MGMIISKMMFSPYGQAFAACGVTFAPVKGVKLEMLAIEGGGANSFVEKKCEKNIVEKHGGAEGKSSCRDLLLAMLEKGNQEAKAWLWRELDFRVRSKPRTQGAQVDAARYVVLGLGKKFKSMLGPMQEELPVGEPEGDDDAEE